MNSLLTAPKKWLYNLDFWTISSIKELIKIYKNCCPEAQNPKNYKICVPAVVGKNAYCTIMYIYTYKLYIISCHWAIHMILNGAGQGGLMFHTVCWTSSISHLLVRCGKIQKLTRCSGIAMFHLSVWGMNIVNKPTVTMKPTNTCKAPVESLTTWNQEAGRGHC